MIRYIIKAKSAWVEKLEKEHTGGSWKTVKGKHVYVDKAGKEVETGKGKTKFVIKEKKIKDKINPLIAEAQKYNTAEDFIQSKPNGIIFNGTLYHNTSYENAKSIKKSGFKVEDSSNLSLDERGWVAGNLGDGVYLSPDYHSNRNLWGGYANLIVKPRHELLLYDAGEHEGAARNIGFELSDKLKKMGYDGIIVNDPHPHSGGFQVVIFDPKKLKVGNIVEQTNIQPSQLNKIDIVKENLKDFWKRATRSKHLRKPQKSSD